MLYVDFWFRKSLRQCIWFVLALNVWFSSASQQYFATGPDRYEEPQHQPESVVVAFLVRNQQATLPWFLGGIDQIDYPKDRISLWVHTDHNDDNSTSILKEWLGAVRDDYHSVHLGEGSDGPYPGEKGPREWSGVRMNHVILKRQEALDYARKLWADYLFFVDSDVYITNRNIFKILMAERKTVIGPMLKTTTSYSNFWSGMNSKGFYERTKDYLPMVNYEKVGTFPVPMVHTALLINLRHRQSRQVNYHPPTTTILSDPDDIIQLALSARLAGVQMYVCNSATFGYVMPPGEADESLEDNEDKQVYLRLSALHDDEIVHPSAHVSLIRPPRDTLGYDQVYLINLDRRTERREKMLHSFDELRIQYKYWPAVDGKKLNDSYLEANNIKMLDAYRDPYHKRPLKAGEIGCFLSHYLIWKDVVEKGYQKVLVFEDDIRFRVFFRQKMRLLDSDIINNGFEDWDLVYIGRKILDEKEAFAGVERLVFPSYTYWTLSYALSQSGAKKLLEVEPLSKMVPVDEFLPIMFDKHPQKKWKEAFPNRNLNTLSINPLAVEPTIYYGSKNYISDTEDSDIISETFIPQTKQGISHFEPSTKRLPDEL